jgi:hypothetical protein
MRRYQPLAVFAERTCSVQKCETRQDQRRTLNVPKDIKHADDGVLTGLWPSDVDVEAAIGLFGTLWGVIGEYRWDGATGFAC